MRETTEIKLVDGGKERLFKITQMSAYQQEAWIIKVVTILSANAKNVEGISKMVTGEQKDQANAILGMIGGLKYEDIRPLYDELLECVSYIPDETNKSFEQPLNAKNVDSIITDFKNLFKLRMEALKLNFSFFSEGESAQPPKEQQNVITFPKTTR